MCFRILECTITQEKYPKLFLNFCLPDHIPDKHFYKVLKAHLDLSFVYKSTKDLYSHAGKPNIDPVVFFKCLLIRYLENICSDRALEHAIKLQLDLQYFIRVLSIRYMKDFFDKRPSII